MRNSVAVLYLDNLSRDTADAYLADGLTEEITARVGRVQRLVVKSRNAVRRYRGAAADDPAAVGRALAVTYLVSGSVRRAGPRLRVSIELIRAATGDRLWGEQYDRNDADLLAMEEDIARTVTTAIVGRLLPTERASLAARATRNPAAYDHFLKGNYYLAQRTPRAVQRAIDEYQTAVRLDPDFAQALARVALSYGLLVDRGMTYAGWSPDSLIAHGAGLVNQALQRDSALPDAWVASGLLLGFQHPRDFAGVSAAYERAIALDPRDAEAYHGYGVSLLYRGEDSAAIAMLDRALTVEPGRPVSLLWLALEGMITGDYATARRWLDSALSVDPAFYGGYLYRGFLRLYLGDTAGARTDVDIAARIPSGFPLPREVLLAATEASEGDTAAARRRLDQLVAADGLGRFTELQSMFLARGWLALGDTERALDVMEHVHPRGARLAFFLRFPWFATLRADARVLRLIEESRPPGAPKH